MGALVGAVAQALITKAAASNAGLLGSISKTKVGANALGTTALTMVDWGAVANKDPEAIGKLVVLLLTWGYALYGRWKTDKA